MVVMFLIQLVKTQMSNRLEQQNDYLESIFIHSFTNPQTPRQTRGSLTNRNHAKVKDKGRYAVQLNSFATSVHVSQNKNSEIKYKNLLKQGGSEMVIPYQSCKIQEKGFMRILKQRQHYKQSPQQIQSQFKCLSKNYQESQPVRKGEAIKLKNRYIDYRNQRSLDHMDQASRTTKNGHRQLKLAIKYRISSTQKSRMNLQKEEKINKLHSPQKLSTNVPQNIKQRIFNAFGLASCPAQSPSLFGTLSSIKIKLQSKQKRSKTEIYSCRSQQSSPPQSKRPRSFKSMHL